MRDVGSGSSADEVEAPLEGTAGLSRIAAREGTEADEPFGETGEARVAQALRQLARVLRILAGEVGVAGPELDEAALHQRPGAQGIADVGLGDDGPEVAGRRRQVAPPPMDPSEGDLDHGQIRRLGERRRGLERRDGFRVLAEARPQFADPRVRRRGVGHVERQRRGQVVDGLAIGEHGLGAIGRLEEGGGGLGRAARLAFVRRDQGVPGEVVSVRAGADRAGARRRRADG